MLSVFFVDDDAAPAGDGTSWTTSFDDLQAVLDAAVVLNTDDLPENDIDQIWIAEGTYLPSKQLEADDPRSASFILVDGVSLFGGFAGTEAALADRVLGGHETVLSGDLSVVDDPSDNAYAVVYCAQGVEAAIDGLTVTGGNADGDYYSVTMSDAKQSYGGGVFSLGILVIMNSSIVGNTAHCGGGVSNMNTTMTVMNSTLSENAAVGMAAYGGGILNNAGTLTVTNLTASRNDAFGGGGICNWNGVMSVTNSTVVLNSAYMGGGVFIMGSSTTLNNSILARSIAQNNPDLSAYGQPVLSGSCNFIGIGTANLADELNGQGNQIGTSTAPHRSTAQ